MTFQDPPQPAEPTESESSSRPRAPSGGFGNLIALPLQRRARENGNSVFVDETLAPHPDQWAFLSSLHRLSSSDVTAILTKGASAGLHG